MRGYYIRKTYGGSHCEVNKCAEVCDVVDFNLGIFKSLVEGVFTDDFFKQASKSDC